MRTAAKKIPTISPDVEVRLFGRIEKRADGIWAWLGNRSRPHSATIHILGRIFFVNRVMWVLNRRRTDPAYQIPDGMDVCHRNDVTPEIYDCNPENLWLGTHHANMQDRKAKDRGNRPIGNRNGSRIKPECLKRGDNHPSRLNPERVARGEKNGRAEVSWSDVREIRALYATGEITQKKIADRFGVTKGAISKIILRRTWVAE